MSDADSVSKVVKMASNARVQEKDRRYLAAYPFMRDSIKCHSLGSASDAVLISHAVYVWMPVQMHFRPEQIEKARLVLFKARQTPKEICSDDIQLLANTFGTIRGDSVSAASKILHFINDDHFPIWDSRIKKVWGNQGYIEYKNAMHDLLGNAQVNDALKLMRSKLGSHGFNYPISDIRTLELILFMGAKE
jgi:hypothetical protein